jgi:hypothetical protein
MVGRGGEERQLEEQRKERREARNGKERRKEGAACTFYPEMVW